MNVNAVSCTPIKPQVSFGESENYNTYSAPNLNELDDIELLNKRMVDSGEIKSPLGICLSVAASVLGIYATGRMLGTGVSSVFKSVPVKFESLLKKGSKTLINSAEKLTENSSGKLGKLKNAAGKALSKTEEIARNGYKRIAYNNIPQDIEGAKKAAAAFRNVTGATAVISAVPNVLGRDSDGNGVKDIVERTQNAYTGTKNKVSGTLEDITLLGEVVSALT